MDNPLHIREDAHTTVMQAAHEHFGTNALRTIIIVWALVIIAMALVIDNPWILAGILAWEVLP